MKQINEFLTKKRIVSNTFTKLAKFPEEYIEQSTGRNRWGLTYRRGLKNIVAHQKYVCNGKRDIESYKEFIYAYYPIFRLWHNDTFLSATNMTETNKLFDEEMYAALDKLQILKDVNKFQNSKLPYIFFEFMDGCRIVDQRHFNDFEVKYMF